MFYSIFSMLCSIFSMFCIIFSMFCSIFSMFYSIFSMLCSISSMFCSIFSMFCSIFSMSCSIFSMFFKANHVTGSVYLLALEKIIDITAYTSFCKVGSFIIYLRVRFYYIQDLHESSLILHYTQNVENLFLNILTNFAIKVFF